MSCELRALLNRIIKRIPI